MVITLFSIMDLIYFLIMLSPICDDSSLCNRYKLSWIGEKKAELNLYQTKLSQVQGEMDQIDTQRQELEIEHDSIARVTYSIILVM